MSGPAYWRMKENEGMTDSATGAPTSTPMRPSDAAPRAMTDDEFKKSKLNQFKKRFDWKKAAGMAVGAMASDAQANAAALDTGGSNYDWTGGGRWR